MAKILKISFPEKCIGCELCVIEVQRQMGKLGLEGSLIRVFRNPSMATLASNAPSGIAPIGSDPTPTTVLVYSIEMDPKINQQNIEKIKDICPTGVFTIEESAEDYDLLK